MSTIQFRFNSSKKFDAVTFSGMMIKLLELKRAIVDKKQLARGHLDFDLAVSNAQTNEVYDDDNMMIQKNTSVVVKRVPATGSSGLLSRLATGKTKGGGRAPKPIEVAAPVAAAPAVAAPGSRAEVRVKINRMRLTVARRLKEAQNVAAMLTTFQECDMTELMALRSKHKDEFEKKHGVKLGFMSAFVKASTEALQEIPAVNAYFDGDNKEMVYRDYCDVSVAVASPAGLVVPVIRNAESMDFMTIEKTIAGYGKKAKDGMLAIEDMAGGTFTISNGGVFGSLMGTPILNPPQSAILGMHATKMRAVVVNGQVVARPMMYLALTYDHRMVDGREAVTFLKSIASKIEDPHRMMLKI